MIILQRAFILRNLDSNTKPKRFLVKTPRPCGVTARAGKSQRIAAKLSRTLRLWDPSHLKNFAHFEAFIPSNAPSLSWFIDVYCNFDLDSNFKSIWINSHAFHFHVWSRSWLSQMLQRESNLRSRSSWSWRFQWDQTTGKVTKETNQLRITETRDPLEIC